jgi:hypothetical protein
VNNGTLGTAVVTNSAAGDFIYTPKANIYGTDSFTFVANDGKTDSQSATVTVTVLPVNDPPTAMDDIASTGLNTPVVIDVLGNDSDVEDETLLISSVKATSNASVIFDGNKVTYSPSVNFSGTDTFTYVVTDPQGSSSNAVVTVEVKSAPVLTPRTDPRKERNYPPVASNSLASVNEDGTVQGIVVANDPEGGVLTYAMGTAPAHGTITLNPATGSFIYTPALNYFGTDSFTFSVNDGQFKSKTGTVSITIIPVNDIPQANPDSVIIDSGTKVSINVLANDTDADNDALIINKVANGAHGATGISDNKIMYTPEYAYSGADEFSYEVSDGNGGVVTGQVNITLLQGNDTPVASSSTVTVPLDMPTPIILLATDPENDPLTYTIIDNPIQGTVSRTEKSDSYLYTPNKNITGADMFTFTASDGTSTSNKATVTINIATLPVAAAGGPYYGFTGNAINFDASGSSSKDTMIVSYEWDWDNDGIFDEKLTPPAVVVQHIWHLPYIGDVGLKITDNLGVTSVAKASVDIMVLGDQDGDNDFDNIDAALFEKNYPIALGNCTGNKNYTREMDLNIDGCITENDMMLFQKLYQAIRYIRQR